MGSIDLCPIGSVWMVPGGPLLVISEPTPRKDMSDTVRVVDLSGEMNRRDRCWECYVTNFLDTGWERVT